MYGIVALLDENSATRVVALWRAYQRDWGVKAVPDTPIPHFSFHVALGYPDTLAPLLADYCATQGPLSVSTSGLGLFLGDYPVIYAPIVRHYELTLLHRDIYRRAHETAIGANEYYAPHAWLPHITLAQNAQLTLSVCPQQIAWFAQYTYHWRISITQLALISNGIDAPLEVFPLASR